MADDRGVFGGELAIGGLFAVSSIMPLAVVIGSGDILLIALAVLLGALFGYVAVKLPCGDWLVRALAIGILGFVSVGILVTNARTGLNVTVALLLPLAFGIIYLIWLELWERRRRSKKSGELSGSAA